jgi:hypothetical protein
VTPHTTAFLSVARRRGNLLLSDINISMGSGLIVLQGTLRRKVTRRDDFRHELRLTLNVRLAIARIPSCELELQSRIRCQRVRMRAEMISERAVIAPEIAVDLSEMQVVLPRISAPEEIAANDSLFTAIDIARLFERIDCNLAVVIGTATAEQIEYRLGGQSRNRCATSVLENQRDSTSFEDRHDARNFFFIEAGPRRVVRHYAYNS